MGSPKQGRRGLGLSIIFLLIFSQIIFIAGIFQYNKNQYINQGLSNNPIENRNSFVVNSVLSYCYDFIIAEDQMYVLGSMGLEILDILEPSEPIVSTLNETFSTALTIPSSV